MIALSRWRLAALLALAPALSGHAPPTPIPVPPMHTEGNLLVDSTNLAFVLRGVEMPGLEVASPVQADLDAQHAMTAFTFRIIQQRWNMNAVRLPVSPAVWRRDGNAYLDKVAAIVAAANQESLVVVLAAYGDVRSGAVIDIGLPNSDVAAFWTACATRFKDTPGLIFDLYNEPSTRNIPGATPNAHRPDDWRVWLNGGSLSGGQTAVGVQTLTDAIRLAGAQQIVAAPSFHDTLDFQGFGPDFYIHDANAMYETHPFFDHGTTEAQWDANYGFLGAVFPMYAGAWGMPFGQATPSCTAIPTDLPAATDLLYRTMTYFDQRGISWTIADFQPGSLIQNFTYYSPTLLNSWTCDSTHNPTNGIGQYILFVMTGDPSGFGSLDPNQIASDDGGPVAPVSPGEIISIYGQKIGPPVAVAAQLDASGDVSTQIGETQVFFDGVAAPIFLAGAFQVVVQVPYEVAGRTASAVQLVYHTVPSNIIQLALEDAAPGILTPLAQNDAAAFNQDGAVNNSVNAAPLGSILTIFAIGCGQTSPASATGVPARLPPPSPAEPVTVTIGSEPAEILFAGAAPGLVGVTQVNFRIPSDLPVASGPARASVILTVGGHPSRPGITFWVQ